jgi:NADH-quinone oxidoreductase subunit D
MWGWKYREIVLDILEQITGNRQHYAMFKVGGVRRDIEEEDVADIYAGLKKLERVNKMFKGAVMDDPVLHKRLKGVGVLSREDAIDFCVLGPTARASGLKIDVRKDDPYAAYDKVDWDIVVMENGDVFDKAAIRILEVFESIKIIRQCLKKMPKGEIDANVKEIPPGEGIGRHEAPRGEVFHYIKSDGSNRPARHKIRAPSYMNVPSNKVAARGQTISDSAITLAAVDPCYCCTERMIVVDSRTEKEIMETEDLIRLSQQKTERLRVESGRK